MLSACIHVAKAVSISLATYNSIYSWYSSFEKVLQVEVNLLYLFGYHFHCTELLSIYFFGLTSFTNVHHIATMVLTIFFITLLQ